MDSSDAIRFENRYYKTARTLRPVVRSLSPLWIRILYGFFLVTGLLFLASGIALLLPVLLIAIGLSGLFRHVWIARTSARNYRRLMNGEVPETIVRFTDAEITGHEARNESHYRFEQFTGVRSTRGMWLLTIGGQMGLVVSKTGFTRGSAADFPAFIRSKCPGIKGRFN